MNDYKRTLNLPQTDFEMRAGLAKKEPRLLAEWQERKLYEEILAARVDAEPFVLHDGPPYANGHLHHGHILNKVLKDMVVKDRSMRGFRTAFIPGWDCHGLPIEVQVDKQLGKKKAQMSKVEIRRACRAYAEEAVSVQREEFRRLGVLGRWEAPYLTMSYGYEAQTLRELAKVVDAGLLYKGLRPVNWCRVHRTALAEAEVEYEDHTSPSVYVAFRLLEPPVSVADGEAVELVIWTTTPWTLPANLAIAVHPELTYVAYRLEGRIAIVAEGLLPSFLAAIGVDERRENIVARFGGTDLEGLRYQHPFVDRQAPVILGEHVTLEAGTGCVHTAPGHGADDFDVGRRYGLEVLSPVDDAGMFTDAAGPFAGTMVFAANRDIIATLIDNGALLNGPDETISHRYAHCWRCHTPIILRATEQWFVAMDKPFGDGATLRERALAALDEVRWIPAWGEDRIRGMLAARPDWCLSRQRTWGVPIAVFYCTGCGEPLLDAKLMEKVAARFEEGGADVWFELPAEELAEGARCGKCGGASLRKEEDILDVWFDSGVSYAAVIERQGEARADGAPVDLYLEGSDQHRGWFHSALLCSLATRQRPPYRQVLTHGFVVDGQGKKISKSKGNFVDPFVAIEQNGAELLRLWVATEDYREDVRLSGEILTRLTDLYRKLRNTVRYLLGNISDLDPARDLVAFDELLAVDAYALAKASAAVDRMLEAYASYNFHVVVHTVNELCTVELSAFYLDILKDRLYASPAGSLERRSAQSVLYVITRDLLRMMAPVLCFTAEEAWRHLRRFDSDPNSVHLATYPTVREPEAVAELQRRAREEAPRLLDRFEPLREVRRQVNSALEEARRNKVIGSSTEAAVTLRAGAALGEQLVAAGDAALEELLIVSAVTLEPGGDALGVEVARAAGTKCPRCWLYRQNAGSDDHPDVCERCRQALRG